MGVVGSKSPLERRNTVLRRSQRRSIHGIKSKSDKIIKDIKKFKGTEENTEYIELKARIESAERELKHHVKTLQPQIRHIYNEALKRTEECHKLLNDKLTENQEKLKTKLEKEAAKVEKEAAQEDKKDDDDDVFVEEINEEPDEAEKRKTVELKFIQVEVEPIAESPQINKRFSAMKIGVPVMPGSLMESLHKKNEDLNLKYEKRVSDIRKEIETLEVEISQFVGRRNGRYYNKIKRQLDTYSMELECMVTPDEDIQEQIKLCSQYIDSCRSFLDEKAVDDDDSEEDDDIMTNSDDKMSDSNLSPRSIRTTYI